MSSFKKNTTEVMTRDVGAEYTSHLCVQYFDCCVLLIHMHNVHTIIIIMVNLAKHGLRVEVTVIFLIKGAYFMYMCKLPVRYGLT